MVNKVAVIALVAIIACPILIGYGMSLSETTKTVYEQDGQPVNVTPLLKNGTGYNYVHADFIDLNTRVYHNKLNTPPEYVSNADSRSSIPLTQDIYRNSSVHPGNPQTFTNYTYYSYIANYDPDQGELDFRIVFNDDSAQLFYRMYANYYDYTDNTFYYQIYFQSDGEWYISSTRSLTDVKSIQYSHTGTYIADTCISYLHKSLTPKYVDVSAGYYLNRFAFTNSPDPNSDLSDLNLPDDPKSVLLTIDLRTIIDSDHEFSIGIDDRWIRLVKTTTPGLGEQWAAYWDVPGNTSKIADLYYEPSKNYNTYQIYIDSSGIEFRFVGNWPTTIGLANSYIKYKSEWPDTNDINLGVIVFKHRTPVVRVDDAFYRGFTYPIMDDITYEPYQFKANPKTTLTNLYAYGTSIEFAGNTYPVDSSGNITLGTHKISLNKLTLESIKVSGVYENRINGTLINTSANPSSITFNGQWSVNVSTIAQSTYTTTQTEWTPGQFAWNGIDHNFLMVGLITSLAVFIGLGIYAIKSNSKGVIALMIVCGGAAALFFTML